ncbi:MAG: PAS domain S-box protein, partial [Gammaproteobacteria bacterium]|nr:PAS domain S-box protein [Gammaproteobacteria bacterium]
MPNSDVTRRHFLRDILETERTVAAGLTCNSTDLGDVGARILQSLSGALLSDGGIFWQPDDSGHLQGTATRFAPTLSDFAADTSLPALDAERDPAGQAFAGGAVVSAANLDERPGTPWTEHARKAGVRSITCIPLCSGARTFGVIELLARCASPWSPPELEELGILGHHLALHIERGQSGQMFRDLVQLAPDAMMAVGADGRIQLANQKTEELFGFKVSELIGQSIELLIPPGSRAGHAHLRDAYHRTPSRRDMGQGRSLRAVRKDGSDFPVEISLSPLRAAGEQIVVCSIRDLSERLALHEQLSRARRLEAIGQLAAGVAHEINTPSQFVGDNLQFISEAMDDILAGLAKLAGLAAGNTLIPATEVSSVLTGMDHIYLHQEIPKALEQAREGSQRISTIVKSMKDFSHPGAQRSKADLNRAIESTIVVATNEWKYVAELVTDFDASLPMVSVLLGEFNQVVLNLLVNAAHAIAEVNGGGKGVITVTTRYHDDRAEVRITDTGAGIPEEIRSRVFDSFFTTKGVGKGTGQGLALAWDVIVNKHGGTISIESSVGTGTSFLISLPV